MPRLFWLLISFHLTPLPALFSQTLGGDHPPDSLRLRITFPTDGDTLNFDRIRYSGRAGPTAVVLVQGDETKVYPSGAFVGRVELQPGENRIGFVTTDEYGTLQDTLRIFREPSLAPLAERPTQIRTERISPAKDVSVIPGDGLEVRFLASPGGKATFSLDKIAKDVPMTELSAKTQGDIAGWYHGSILIPPSEKYKPKSVEFKFKGKDGRKLKFKSEGKVHLLSLTVPYVGVTRDSTNLVLTAPDGEVWMQLPSDIRMQIVGERGGFKKVKLADSVTGYITTHSVTALPAGEKLPFASIGSMGTLQHGEWLQLRINLSERVPFQIEQILTPAALEITFFRSHQASHWITYPQEEDTIKLIRWRQESGDRFVLQIDLNQQQQWGYWGRYVGNQFRLDIRRKPNLIAAPGTVLQGLVIAIDPGHGGEFDGAASPTGLLEKTVNLEYAMVVADLLEAEGAKVVRTRTNDTTMTLTQRVQLATEADAHIFISLHNNSIGAATNPVRPRGTSTYYTVPQSQAISRSVYRQLLALRMQPFGLVSSTYFVTRQTNFLSFIVEGAFLTHPEDEMLLLEEEFLRKLAQAVVDGVKDFVVQTVAREHGTLSNGIERVQPTQPNLKKR